MDVTPAVTVHVQSRIQTLLFTDGSIHPLTLLTAAPLADKNNLSEHARILYHMPLHHACACLRLDMLTPQADPNRHMHYPC